jgi:glycerophosphoryl diester phosphodiesterase
MAIIVNEYGETEGLVTMEDIIEEKRKALTTRTPVTLERLIEWLEKKKAAAAAAESADLEEKRAAYAKTGKAVFAKRYPSETTAAEFHVSTLEEELQLIQGLNRSLGRNVGIYPEIKQPKWHREQGHDISRVVLPILARYGYATKADACFLQCFEIEELRRVRSELGWRGRSIFLLDGKAKGVGGEGSGLLTAAGLQELAAWVDGIGPSLGQIVAWPSPAGAAVVTDLVKQAHAAKLLVHPYTIRLDELPKNCPSIDALHTALFNEAGIDGVFTDFTDLTLAWLRSKR